MYWPSSPGIESLYACPWSLPIDKNGAGGIPLGHSAGVVCSRPGVSRILLPRSRRNEATTISLGRLLPAGSSSLPADVPAFTEAPCGRGFPLIWPCCRWGLPCRWSHPQRGALLPHHFTLTGIASGGILSVALSVGLLRLDVIKHQARQSGMTRSSAVRTFLTGKNFPARSPLRPRLDNYTPLEPPSH